MKDPLKVFHRAIHSILGHNKIHLMVDLENIQELNTALETRYADKLSVNFQLNRQLVSFQANKNRPGYRWFKYKEGFSEPLIQHLFDYLGLKNGQILDPFAGTGTALFVASERGLNATGIELLPVGCEIMTTRKLVQSADNSILINTIERWRNEKPWKKAKGSKPLTHLRITKGAFPAATEMELGHFLWALELEEESAAKLLHFAAMCVLEEISYTRKDGQYLRWDHRSSRRQGRKPFDKGEILDFDKAIIRKLNEIFSDLHPPDYLLGFFEQNVVSKGQVDILEGSCLDILPTIPSDSYDGLITSPPYVNRYDYTRTYALELALLNVGEEEIKALRQAMISCTVENREKHSLFTKFSPKIFRNATNAFDNQQELQSVLTYLDWQKEVKALNNSGIPRMVRNYFFELALIIFECARILKHGAPFVMVNDNVRYGGAMIPVDLILSDFAKQAGFAVDAIWVLPAGKGNSSQQMGIHGREEVRKCIYIWRKKAE